MSLTNYLTVLGNVYRILMSSETSKYVWLRTDKVRKPLEAPSTGPIEVLHLSQKYFTLKLSDYGNNTVSVDRLKLALILKIKIDRSYVEYQPESNNTLSNSKGTVRILLLSFSLNVKILSVGIRYNNIKYRCRTVRNSAV